MKSQLQKIKNDNKKKIIYARTLTNKMTIVGWKLFKRDRVLHFAFILYRLKRDFGFTQWEIANLTGIPVNDVNNFQRRMKPILDSEILKILGRMDDKEELHAWREVPNRSKQQGYYVVRDYPAWFEKRKKKYTKKPDITFGADSEKEMEEKLNAK